MTPTLVSVLELHYCKRHLSEVKCLPTWRRRYCNRYRCLNRRYESEKQNRDIDRFVLYQHTTCTNLGRTAPGVQQRCADFILYFFHSSELVAEPSLSSYFRQWQSEENTAITSHACESLFDSFKVSDVLSTLKRLVDAVASG